MPLLSLPALLRTTLATVPAEVPYLSVPESLVASWGQRLGEARGLRVGLCWQGSPRHRNDRHRSFPLATLEPLARVSDICLVSLQQGHGTKQLAPLRRRFPVLELGPAEAGDSWDFSDTAAIMKNLDLVISVDTAVAHLAGALGVPVWIALPKVPDCAGCWAGMTRPGTQPRVCSVKAKPAPGSRDCSAGPRAGAAEASV